LIPISFIFIEISIISWRQEWCLTLFDEILTFLMYSIIVYLIKPNNFDYTSLNNVNDDVDNDDNNNNMGNEEIHEENFLNENNSENIINNSNSNQANLIDEDEDSNIEQRNLLN
jgi:hypothetical protein